MGVGRGPGGPWSPLDFEIISKKRLFFQFRGIKTNSTTFGHPWKNFGKIPFWPPLEKILPTPMAGMNLFPFFQSQQRIQMVVSNTLSFIYRGKSLFFDR